MSSTTAPTSGQHRYGLVLLLTIVAVMYVIVAPDTPVGHGWGVALEGAILLAVIATSDQSRTVRVVMVLLTAAAFLGIALAVGLSIVPRRVGSVVAGGAVITVLLVLVHGVTQLIRRQGVTPRAVAGALAIYLLVGLTFAVAINVLALVGSSAHYFSQGIDGTQGEQVYFSFTTMTTTGYGDLTPATSAGHALAVLEMLVGQIYLVTVIGLLVGNLNRRASRSRG